MINDAEYVPVTVRFISIMQKYAGNKRELEMELPADPAQAVDIIINRFHIPWSDNLEKSTRIFINQQLYSQFVNSETRLKAEDIIAFIPISGGG